MFKSTLILALLVFVTGKNIEMYKAQLETPLPKEEVIVNTYPTIQLHYASHKTTQKKFDLPDIDTSSNESFVYSLNRCINYLYDYIEIEDRIPNELVIAQAVIETGWGKSRFANEGNNLFGIRTWDKDEPYLLPIPWTEWPGWGVKSYTSKCESVVDYLHILNNVSVFKDLRNVRDTAIENGEEPDPILMANHLDKYASKKNYTDLVKTIIKFNLRGVYEI
jgi:uncharacterized FlgJ-related protein